MDSLKEQFDKKVNELHNSNYETEEVVEFGYRWLDEQEEIHTVTDWDNVWKWFEANYRPQIEERVRREMVKNIQGIVLQDGEYIIVGQLDESDENHNCDAMGCNSIYHAIKRKVKLLSPSKEDNG